MNTPTPERSVEEKLKSLQYTESDIKLILEVVSPTLQAERQKREEMVEAERKNAHTKLVQQFMSYIDTHVIGDYCDAKRLLKYLLALTHTNNPK